MYIKRKKKRPESIDASQSVYVCVYMQLCSQTKMNIVRREVVENRSSSRCRGGDTLKSSLPTFLQSPVYRELQSYILLLKSDATVLALPSIDRQ